MLQPGRAYICSAPCMTMLHGLFIYSLSLPFIQAFTHPFMHPFLHSFSHLSINPSSSPLTHSFIHSFMHSFIHSFIHSFFHASIHPLFHSSIHPFIHVFSLSFIPLLTHCLQGQAPVIKLHTRLHRCCRETFETEAAALVSHKNLEMLCLTWNVNEQRPDGSPLFKWITDLSAKASVAVIALQEIEMGGGSVAVAAAKDILNKSAQVSCLSGGCLSGELYLKKSHRAGTRSLQWQDRYSLYWLCQKQTLGTGACRCTVASPIFSSCCCVPARQCKTQACACFVHVLGSLPCLCCLHSKQ